jgi:putative ABC transport system permease protein
VRDLLQALRQLRRAPGFTAAAVLTLALGIGACAAIVSVVEGVVLHPLPFPDGDRLVVLNESNPPAFPLFTVRPMAAFPDWKKYQTSFEGLAVVRDGSYNLTGAGDPLRVYVGKATANVFPTLRVRPALGRGFTAEEETPGKGDLVVLSHGFWQRQFGGRGVLGETVTLDGRPHRIIGVMPAGFTLDGNFDLYVPDSYQAFREDESDNRTIDVFARLKPGVTIAQARAELEGLYQRLGKENDDFLGWRPVVRPMLDAKVDGVRRPLWALLGAVGFLLLIACANVANLLLARATARTRELAVRAALGATRARLVRQLLAESLVLAALGGAAGVVLARWGLDALLAFAPDSLPRAQEIAVDGRVLAITFGLALLTGVGAGLAPALAGSRPDLNRTLKESGRGTLSGHHRVRAALVVLEVAVALVLLAGAGLLARGFARLATAARGFQPAGALVVNLTLPQEKYRTPAQMATFARAVEERAGALPGVTGVGTVQDLPFAGGLNLVPYIVEGRPLPSLPKEFPVARYYSITPGYLRAMGIPLLRGRTLDEGAPAGPSKVTLVNAAFARKEFPGQDPIGKRIAGANRPDDLYEIVGVVGDVQDESLVAHPASGMQVYAPLAQNPAHTLTFVVRGAGPGLPDAIRAAVREVDPLQPVASLRPLADLVSGSLARERFAMFLFAVFSAAALLLAAIGIYGVMAYSVAQRTAEIGVRLALGARTGHVLALVLLQGGRLVALGIAAGTLAALALTRLLESMLFGVSAHDPFTLAVTALLLALVAALACLVPAHRATRVNPMTALRSE